MEIARMNYYFTGAILIVLICLLALDGTLHILETNILTMVILDVVK